MEGKTLTRDVWELLGEESDSSFLDEKTTYEYIYQAALAFNRETYALTSSQSITTLESTSEYNLSPSFQCLYMKNKDNQYIVKITDSDSVDYFATFKPYTEIYFENNSTDIDIPTAFSIMDTTQVDNITNTASIAGDKGAASLESTLTDTTSATQFSTVSIGDTVHNVTDGSSGSVIALTSATALLTALVGGTDNEWDAGDTYYIIPQNRYKIVFNQPFETAGYTVTVPYVQKPTPIYSPYRSYRFNNDYKMALVHYAVWLYKYRDMKPNYGDQHYKYFVDETRRAKKDMNKALNRTGFKVNFIKR